MDIVGISNIKNAFFANFNPAYGVSLWLSTTYDYWLMIILCFTITVKAIIEALRGRAVSVATDSTSFHFTPFDYTFLYYCYNALVYGIILLSLRMLQAHWL